MYNNKHVGGNNMKNQDNREQLDTNLYKKIMDDKVKMIVKLTEARDAIVSSLETKYSDLENLKKQRKEIRKNIRIQRRAIVKAQSERYSLNRELSKQLKLSNDLTVKYSNEGEEIINSQKYYPETAKKTR
jgi:hypothetical protein